MTQPMCRFPFLISSQLSHTVSDPDRVAVIVMGGSFSPVHNGHIACLQTARNYLLEKRGFTHVIAFFAVATEGYVRQKYAKKKATHILLHHRLALVNALAAASDGFLQFSQKPHGSAAAMISQQLQHQFPGKPDDEFFIVVGADRARPRRGKFETIAVARAVDEEDDDGASAHSSGCVLLTAPAETLSLSATAIRKRLCIGCSSVAGHSDECVAQRVAALQTLRESALLPAEVCDYFEENPDAVPF